MDPGKALVADSKAMEIMEPGMSTLDYPSIFSKATAMLGAALRENRFDTPITQFLPVCFGVVSAIGIDDLGLSQRSTADTTDGWNRVNEGKQLCDVVSIGTSQDDREWQPICGGRNMVFGTRSRTIYRGSARFLACPDSPNGTRIEKHA
jgi:hypothetical protein